MSTAYKEWRQIAVVAVAVSAFLLVVVLASEGRMSQLKRVVNVAGVNTGVTAPHRKLVLRSTRRISEPPQISEPTRIWGEIKPCNPSDIQVIQGPGAPLPSGIPTYIVVVTNACVTGCNISNIHMRCGWFSSARLINPSIFKRLEFDDCLVNGGLPLYNGASLTFQYANSFSYPLSVSHIACV